MENENLSTNTTATENTDAVNEKSVPKRRKSSQGSESGNKKSKKSDSIGSEIFSWVKTIVLALVLAYVITHVIIVNAVVPSASMETTVMTGDRLVANRLSYLVGAPERYDIEVFKYPDDESVLYIKRVIGMPGETIQIKEGNVFVIKEDGTEEKLDASFVNGSMNTGDLSRYPATYKIPKKGDLIADYESATDANRGSIVDPSVYDKDNDGKFDEDCYFMMGDNRDNSSDSRFWGNTYLSADKMEGKAVFRYWPINTIGLIK